MTNQMVPDVRVGLFGLSFNGVVSNVMHQMKTVLIFAFNGPYCKIHHAQTCFNIYQLILSLQVYA